MASNFDSVIRKSELHDALADPMVRIDRERRGMPISIAEALRKQMGLSTGEFSRTFGVKPATYRKKIADNKPLSGRDGDAIADLGEILAMLRGFLLQSAPDSTSLDGLPDGLRFRSPVSVGASQKKFWTLPLALAW